MKEKKEFKQAEVEVIKFEKTDVIATSQTVIGGADPGIGDLDGEGIG